MATVKMKKGDKYADIYDSPEMIAGAEADGYELVNKEKTPENAESDSGDKETQTVKRGKTPRQ